MKMKRDSAQFYLTEVLLRGCKALLFISVFLLGVPVLQAQKSEIHEYIFHVDSVSDVSRRIALLDSVLQVAKEREEPTWAIHVYLELGNIYREIEIDSSIYYFEKSIQLGTGRMDSISQILTAKSFNDMGISYYRHNLPFDAIRAHQKSITLYEQWKHKQGLAWNYNNLAILYAENNKTDSSRLLYEKSLEMALAINDSLGIGYNLINIAGNYLDQGNKIEATQRLFKAVDVFERLDRSTTLAHVYTMLSRAYSDLDPELDYAYALKADSIYQQKESVFLKGKSARLLGVSLQRTGRDSLAVLKLKEGIRNFEKIAHHQMLMLSYMELSRAYRSMGYLDSAIAILQKGLQWISPEYSVRPLNVQSLYEHLSRVYFEVGKMDLAEEFALKAIALNDQSKAPNFVYQEERHLAEILKSRGDFKGAFEHLQKAYDQEIDFMEKNESKVLARLEAEYLSEKEKQAFLFEQQEKENVLKSELESQRLGQNYTLAGLTLTFAFLTIIYFNYTRKKELSDELATVNEELVKLGRFKESMTGMIAHDLKNPLSVMVSNPQVDIPVRKMATQMLNLVHNMLDIQKLESAEVTMEIKPYLLREIIIEAEDQVRHFLLEKNITLEINVDASICVKVDQFYITRLFMNLLTNAIKYSPSNEVIEIDAHVNKHQVLVEITDHGIGIKKEDQTRIFETFSQIDARNIGGAHSSGLGLTFCKLALQAHGSLITVDSQEGEWTRFSFTLPGSDEKLSEEVTGMTRLDKSSLSSAEKEMIREYLPELKQLELHQAIEIENLLKPMREQADDQTKEWVERVLLAAYTHNEQRFDELLEQVDRQADDV